MVFELFDRERNLRRGLFYTRDEADRYPGTQARHLYDIRQIDVPVIFVLEDSKWPDDGGRGVHAAYSTYKSAREARGEDDEVVVWDLHL